MLVNEWFLSVLFSENVVTKQFSRPETEAFDADMLTDLINANICVKDYKFYIFTADLHGYPIPFSVKHYGLWCTMVRKYKLKLMSCKENSLAADRCLLRYGYGKTCFDRSSVELLLNKCCFTWFLFSKQEYDVDDLMKVFLNSDNDKIIINKAKMMELLSLTGNTIVSFVESSGEYSLNFSFAKEKFRKLSEISL